MGISSTTDIHVERSPEPQRLKALGVFSWPLWTKEVSIFPWTYDMSETCYLLEGEVIVTPENGSPVSFQAGDLVTFPAGMSCTWEVLSPVKKHYSFG